jgi:hypothetical protein
VEKKGDCGLISLQVSRNKLNFFCNLLYVGIINNEEPHIKCLVIDTLKPRRNRWTGLVA